MASLTNVLFKCHVFLLFMHCCLHVGTNSFSGALQRIIWTWNGFCPYLSTDTLEETAIFKIYTFTRQIMAKCADHLQTILKRSHFTKVAHAIYCERKLCDSTIHLCKMVTLPLVMPSRRHIEERFSTLRVWKTPWSVETHSGAPDLVSPNRSLYSWSILYKYITCLTCPYHLIKQ